MDKDLADIFKDLNLDDLADEPVEPECPAVLPAVPNVQNRARAEMALAAANGHELAPKYVELMTNMLEQFEDAIVIWINKKMDLNGVPTIPDIAKWLVSLSPLTVDGIIEDFEIPSLVVVPPCSVAEQVVAFNSILTFKKGGDILRNEGTIFWPEGWDEVRAPKWTFGIADLRQDMPFDESLYCERSADEFGDEVLRSDEAMVIEGMRRAAEKGRTIMPQYAFPSAHILAAVNGIAFDPQGIVPAMKHNPFTAFEVKPGMERMPTAATGMNGGFGLRGNRRFDSSKNLRLRDWVGELENG